jgi:hypothetical protein
MATGRGPIPNRPPRRIVLPRAGRIARVAVLAVVAALIGWLAHSAGTKTVTRTVVQPPAAVYQHTRAGAVAAAEASLVQAETICLRGLERCQSPAAYSLGPDGGGLWSLAYRVKSYTSTAAVIEAWQLGIDAGGGLAPSRLAWGLAYVPVTWTGAWWRQQGQVSQAASGPTPPPDQTSGPEAKAFAGQIARYWRFPGAP